MLKAEETTANESVQDLRKETSEDGVIVPHPVNLQQEEASPPESQPEEENKETLSMKSRTNSLPQDLIEHTQNMLDQVKSLLGTFPSDAKSLFYNEVSKYGQMLFALQLEQQKLLMQKEEISLEQHNRVMETESLGKLLSDLIKDDKYSEAEILQQRLNMVSQTVENINSSLLKVTEMLSSNERRKIELYKDKEKLFSSFNEILLKWIV